MFFRSLIGCITILSVASTSFAVEDPDDSYNFRSRCPKDGAAAEAHYTDSNYQDGHGFPICQCVSYVADQLTDAWHPDGQFTNQSYEQARWGNAYRWRDIAHNAGIGVTGSRDDFVWNASEYWQDGIPPYNGAFAGDVAWWGANSHGAGASGHVGMVTSATQDDPGHGVRCVSWRPRGKARLSGFP